MLLMKVFFFFFFGERKNGQKGATSGAFLPGRDHSGTLPAPEQDPILPVFKKLN